MVGAVGQQYSLLDSEMLGRVTSDAENHVI